jgi:hypothetical protein
VIPNELRETAQKALRETAFGLGGDGKIVRGASYH